MSFDAAANPMVHIRAVPEGGAAGSTAHTDLPYTFYDREAGQLHVNCTRKFRTPGFEDAFQRESAQSAAERLRLYEELCNRTPRPFAWGFTTDKLHEFLRKLATKDSP